MYPPLQKKPQVTNDIETATTQKYVKVYQKQIWEKNCQNVHLLLFRNESETSTKKNDFII